MGPPRCRATRCVLWPLSLPSGPCLSIFCLLMLCSVPQCLHLFPGLHCFDDACEGVHRSTSSVLSPLPGTHSAFPAQRQEFSSPEAPPQPDLQPHHRGAIFNGLSAATIAQSPDLFDPTKASQTYCCFTSQSIPNPVPRFILNSGFDEQLSGSKPSMAPH